MNNVMPATKKLVPFGMDIWEEELIKGKGGRKLKDKHNKVGTKSR